MKPLFSVVIPCHERAEEVERVLAGFCAQRPDDPSFEIILVDNNSCMESLERVHRAFRDKLRISLLQLRQLPDPFALCTARNAALRLAIGEWIVSIDSDCIPNQGYLSTARDAVQKQSAQPIIMTGERIFVDAWSLRVDDIAEDSRCLDKLEPILSDANYRRPRDRRFPRIHGLPHVPHAWDLMHGGNTVYRRSDALRIGGFDEEFDGHWGYEDIDFAHRMITTAGCVPQYVAGLHVYHQEPPATDAQPNRYDKASNPNWVRICRRIEGYRDFKMSQSQAAEIDIRYEDELSGEKV